MKLLGVEMPVTKREGRMVSSVDELVDILKNTAQVL